MSNADEVMLMLNGKPLGQQKVDPYEMNEWKVPYAPGRLEAIGLKGGTIVSRATVETTGAPVKLRLTPDRLAIGADGRDAVLVTVEALDSRGRHVPTANLPVQFQIAGGRIIGVGNGDANSHEPDKAMARSLYTGFAQVILQSRRGGAGSLVLKATSSGLKSAATSIKVRPVPPLPTLE